VISVVVLQNPMDLQQCDIGSSRNETTIPEIKTEPEVSAVPVVSVCTFIIGLSRIACLYIWVFL